MTKSIFLFLIIMTNLLFSQDNSISKFNKSEDYFKRILTKNDLLILEWGEPDNKSFNSFDKSIISTYNEKDLFGYYTFLSIDNLIFKVIHLVQCNTDEKTKELYDKSSKTFEEAGFKYVKLARDGFTLNAIKYFKDDIIITHNIFSAPKEGKNTGKDALTIETTITK